MATSIVEVWDVRAQDLKTAVIGVNWAGVGPVGPVKARAIAAAIVRSAAVVERRVARLRAKGWTVRHGS